MSKSHIDLGPCVMDSAFDTILNINNCYDVSGDMSFEEYEGCLHMMIDGNAYSVYQHKVIGDVKIAQIIEFHYDMYIIRYPPPQLPDSLNRKMFMEVYKHRRAIIENIVVKERQIRLRNGTSCIIRPHINE